MGMTLPTELQKIGLVQKVSVYHLSKRRAMHLKATEGN